MVVGTGEIEIHLYLFDIRTLAAGIDDKIDSPPLQFRR